jgi:hypothetical protein
VWPRWKRGSQPTWVCCYEKVPVWRQVPLGHTIL